MKRLPVEIIWVQRPASKPDIDSPLLPAISRLGAKIRRQQRRQKAGAA